MPAAGGSARAVGKIHGLTSGWLDDPLNSLGSPGPAWTADGKHLIVTSGAPDGFSLQVIRVSDGQVRELTRAAGGSQDLYPTLSPDGRMVAFGRVLTNSSSRLFVVPLEGGQPRAVFQGQADIRGIAWSSDQKSLIISANFRGPYQLWRIPADGGEPVPIPTAGTSALEPSVAPDGNALVYSDMLLDSEVVRTAAGAGGKSESVIASTRQNHSAQYSPDGTRIAYVSNASGSWEIWSADSDGARKTPLTGFKGPVVGTVHWSPDGRQLTFDARPRGHSSVYLMNADGSGLHAVNGSRYEEKMPIFSADGRYLYFNSNRDGEQRLWRQELATGAMLRLSDRFTMDSAGAPDGSSVYFIGRENGIWSVPSGGGSATVPAGLESLWVRRLWQVDKRGIWYLGGDLRSVFSV